VSDLRHPHPALERLLHPALEAARRALRQIEDEHIPASLKRVAASSSRRLPPPLADTLLRALEEPWLRRLALEEWSEAGGDLAETVSRLFLERPDGWETDAAEAAARSAEAAGHRTIHELEQRNRVLQARVDELGELLAAARRAASSPATAAGADPERLLESNRRLRARAEGLEEESGRARTMLAEMETILDEADRRVAELRRRLGRRPSGDDRPGNAGITFGTGDPLALARTLDQLNDTLIRVTTHQPGPDEPPPRLALPAGTRPDSEEAVRWLLSVDRPFRLVIDGHNVAHAVASPPDPTVRRRVELAAGRIRRLAEAPSSVTVFWDSRYEETGYRLSGVEIRYVPSADEAAVAMAGPAVVVVSSDRAVREAAERKGAVTLWSEALVGWMGAG
jgi:hypothetical protein